MSKPDLTHTLDDHDAIDSTPAIVVIDAGPTSSRLIEHIKQTLPVHKQLLVTSYRPEHGYALSINPFDLR